MKPFLRWVGGKTWLSKNMVPIIRKTTFNRYIEPFLGGGAFFFELQPDNALLSDVNVHLINTYQQVAINPEAIIKRLKKLESSKETYYKLRAIRPKLAINQAVRFIYLNRNSYGGLYRTNSKGNFNVPFGGGSRNHLQIIKNDTLLEASKALNKNIYVRSCDFSESLEEANSGDLIFCDPVYVSRDHRETFDRYTAKLFSWDDQKRLAKSAWAAYKRGARVIITNLYGADIISLYKEGYKFELFRTSFMSRSLKKKPYKHLLIILDDSIEKQEWDLLAKKYWIS